MRKINLKPFWLMLEKIFNWSFIIICGILALSALLSIFILIFYPQLIPILIPINWKVPIISMLTGLVSISIAGIFVSRNSFLIINLAKK